MSLSTAYLPVFSSMTRPIAMPATALLSGTPASIIASEPPQTEAIEDDPFDSRMSDTTRIVYGNCSSTGIIGVRERSASAPWPTSRRPGPRRNATSPTEKGGKVEWGMKLLQGSPPQVLIFCAVPGG